MRAVARTLRPLSRADELAIPDADAASWRYARRKKGQNRLSGYAAPVGSALKLVDATFALLGAAVEGRVALETALGASVADGWEGFPEALPVLQASYQGDSEPRRWGSLFFIKTDVRTLVGFGGFKGAPSAEGVVEIGYAIAPAFRRQGLATDAVAQMIERALADGLVRAVDAHTLGCENASTRVLQRAGFRKLAEWDDATDGPIWHWRLERSARC